MVLHRGFQVSHKTVAESAMMESVEMKLRSGELSYPVLCDLRDGYIAAASRGRDDEVLLINAIRQRARAIDIYEAATIALILDMALTGEVSIQEIHIGSCPHEDAAIEKNQAALNQSLVGFVATVCPDQNGSIMGGNDGTVEHIESGLIVPLEIGDTAAATSWFHITHEFGLFRWPYRSERALFFKTKNPARIVDLVAGIIMGETA